MLGKIERIGGLMLALYSAGRLVGWSRLSQHQFQLLTFSSGVVICGCLAAYCIALVLRAVKVLEEE